MESNNLVDIPEYEGIYKFDLVLNQVYSYHKNRYLKNYLLSNGYYQVSLTKNKIHTKFTIHKLVYKSNNPTEDLTGYDIDHIDCDKNNNKIENLRKCSRSDNMSNKTTYITNKLGVKYIVKTKYGYRFQLYKKGKYYSKYFKNLQEAIEYRNIKVKEINGEFANLG